jgi:hypothetical protein
MDHGGYAAPVSEDDALPELSERERQLAILGLRLKLVALALVIFILATAWQRTWPLRSLLGIAIAAVALDLAGRCLCLAIPARPRWTLIVSIVAQSVGAVLAVLCLFENERIILVALGVMAAILQGIAATAFTEYLGVVCRFYDHPETLEHVTLLRRRLRRTIGHATGLTAAAATLAYLLIFSFGAAFLLVCAFMPLYYLWMAVAGICGLLMLWEYGRSLWAVIEVLRATPVVAAPQ